MAKFNIVLRVTREFVIQGMEAVDQQDVFAIFSDMQDEDFDLDQIECDAVIETALEHEIESLDEVDDND